VEPAALLAAASSGLTVANVAAPLQNANTGALVVSFGASDTEIAVATATAAVLPGGLAIQKSRAGIVVTVAANASGVNASFAVTKISGAFALTNVVAGAARPLGNDGYAAGDERDSILADVEVVIGTAYDDTIDATHAYGNKHILYGMDGNDTLIIGAQSTKSNTLYGGKGSDHLFGGSGVDWLYGGDGNDWLAGGLGDDNIDGDGANCVVASTGVYASDLCTSGAAAASGTAGANVLDYSDRTAPVTVDLGKLTDLSNLQIGEVGERDTVINCTNVRGGSGADTLIGDSGSNMIWGGPGDDTISGGAGNDNLYGDMGNDIISGDAGDDFVFGGEGINTIYGDTNGDASVVGNNMVDNSLGTKGTLDCGAGNMDILFSDGHETGVETCELK
jgi:Ca2+-binding RTX toxin-like protein